MNRPRTEEGTADEQMRRRPMGAGVIASNSDRIHKDICLVRSILGGWRVQRVVVWFLILLLVLVPAEARLVGDRQRRSQQKQQESKEFDMVDAGATDVIPSGVSSEFAAKYPSMAAEIRRRRHQSQKEYKATPQTSDELMAMEYSDALDAHLRRGTGGAYNASFVGVSPQTTSRNLQSAQQLTVTQVADRSNPLITLTLDQPSSSSSSTAAHVLENEVRNIKASKGHNRYGAVTLNVEFVLDRPERQTTTSFQVQMNLVSLAMGRSGGLIITAAEQGPNGAGGDAVQSGDALVISEHRGHADNHLHLMAVAPPNKPPASLNPPIVDEAILPP